MTQIKYSQKTLVSSFNTHESIQENKKDASLINSYNTENKIFHFYTA
jgi:hypothetical protein